jgi:hypothetical protein
MDVALQSGEKGAEQMVKVWEELSFDPQVTRAGIALLKQYVRRAEEPLANMLPSYFSQRISPEVGKKLQATYTLRQVFGEFEFVGFTEALEFASELLFDMAATYHEDKELPTLKRLRNELDSRSGNLNDEEVILMRENIDQISRHIYTLGNDKKKDQRIEDLVRNQAAPESGLEMLLFLGGRFNHKTRVDVDLTLGAMAHLFGNRSAVMLMRETTLTRRLFENLITAFEKTPGLDLAALSEELDSLWKQLSLYNQRQLQPKLGKHSQQTAFLMVHMSQRVKERVFSNRQLESGNQQPKNSIEALRYMVGYFRRESS